MKENGAVPVDPTVFYIKQTYVSLVLSDYRE